MWNENNKFDSSRGTVDSCLLSGGRHVRIQRGTSTQSRRKLIAHQSHYSQLFGSNVQTISSSTHLMAVVREDVEPRRHLQVGFDHHPGLASMLRLRKSSPRNSFTPGSSKSFGIFNSLLWQIIGRSFFFLRLVPLEVNWAVVAQLGQRTIENLKPFEEELTLSVYNERKPKKKKNKFFDTRTCIFNWYTHRHTCWYTTGKIDIEIRWIARNSSRVWSQSQNSIYF